MADGEIVDILVNDESVGTATVIDDEATYQWIPTEAGEFVIRADYAGPDTVEPAQSAELTITVKDAMNLQRCLPGLCPDHPEGLTKELHDKLLQPRILVDYDRTPFVCNAGNTRITLDENLRTRPYSTDLFASPSAMIPVLDDDQVILEVKFDDFLPGYLSEVLADIPRVPMAVSKFAFCMSLL